jgi:heme O synthase-like polyprenyltransferase
VYLFLLLFLWQLPHFLAINWMYREEYRKGGFIMWANEDHAGTLTARLALGFSVLTAALMVQPVATGQTSAWFLVPALLVNGVLCLLAARFYQKRDRVSAKRLFLFTLCQLPLLLVSTAAFWRRAS